MRLLKPAFHLLFYSFSFGGSTFYSYVASPIAYKALDIDSFSTLQQNVFPLFFKFQTAYPLILAATGPVALTSGAMTSLATASVTGAVNSFWLLPWTQRIKKERKALAEKSSGDELEARDAPLRKEFGKAHGLSLLFNMIHVISMASYGVILSKSLSS
ncbi:Tmh18p Ecym_2605 [Eremothecium cymbalariae DBVPG|uniref:TMEM205-like domain-containing protein n=1 Tax=Eremothecium cymbalariae (strain CBS 270.75 / DBVPG 7215 / KCTC 17166 / NRRL Y-17582) TaxID=931890 RepID=G8JQI5_ERECY|nr:Hypothetical protein Ecym_2605 [Eremothecium cymbalariae DBVPG\